MQFFIRKTLQLAFFVMLTGFYVHSVHAKDEIVIAGTGDSQDLLTILGQSYEQENPGKKIIVPDSIGSSGGIKATVSGKCDIGRVARTLKESEKYLNLKYRLFAYTPVVFAANKSVVGVENLDFDQIIGIYSGKIVNWQQLGGSSGKIFAANRESGDSSRVILEKEIKGFKEIQNLAGKIIYNTPETAKTIETYINTIGYVPLAMSIRHNLRVFKVNGYEPSKSNVLSGKYHLVVPLGLVWKDELQGLAKDFVKFIFSTKGQKIILANGAVPMP